MLHALTRLSSLLVLLLPGAARAEEMTLDRIFPRDRVIEVKIRLPEEDWDRIREQSRNIFYELSAARKEGPLQNPYAYVQAAVTIDGKHYPQVGVRKKGFIGSLSSTRPSLKIKLDHVHPALDIEGLTTLTLNNNKQDFSLVSQHLGYEIFNESGSLAPRTSYARVTVNGEDLGIYTHVESVRKPMLERGFPDASGPLFEGTVTDFFPGWEKSFEHKRGDEELGRRKLGELIEALHHPGDHEILGADSPFTLEVPADGSDGLEWTRPGFDDSDWKRGQGGAGYERESGYEEHFDASIDLEEALHEKGSSVYLRYEFEVELPENPGEVQLGVKFDDGFIAYLNGHRIASANAPEEADWKSSATGPGADQAAIIYQSFGISNPEKVFVPGPNVLALHALNVDASSSDLLIAPRIVRHEVPLLDRLEKYVDLESFTRFWVIESVLGFWDGYSGNRNNFFIYLDPRTEKFHFIPWGADSLFQKHSMVDRDPNLPLAVKTAGLLAHRLYQIPATRDRYRRELLDFLTKRWNPEKLVERTRQIEELLAPHLEDSSEQGRYREGLEYTRKFILSRRDEILEEIEDGLPEWNRPPGAPVAFPIERRAPNRERGRIRDREAEAESVEREPAEVDEDDVEEEDVEREDTDGDS